MNHRRCSLHYRILCDLGIDFWNKRKHAEDIVHVKPHFKGCTRCPSLTSCKHETVQSSTVCITRKVNLNLTSMLHKHHFVSLLELSRWLGTGGCFLGSTICMVSTRRPLGRELGPLNVAELASFTAAILFYPITNIYHQNALFSVIWFTTWLLVWPPCLFTWFITLNMSLRWNAIVQWQIKTNVSAIGLNRFY